MGKCEYCGEEAGFSRHGEKRFCSDAHNSSYYNRIRLGLNSIGKAVRRWNKRK